MTIKFAVAELSVRTPQEAVRAVIKKFFGRPPPESFIKRWSLEIEKDDLTFLESLLSTWPRRFKKPCYQSKVMSMEVVNDVVSVSFLLSVPEKDFLRAAYSEFFGREVDSEGFASYSSLDFSEPSVRLDLIRIFSNSTEFLSREQILVADNSLVGGLANVSAPELEWDAGAPIADVWYEGITKASIDLLYNPLIIWLDERRTLYSTTGMVVQGIPSEGAIAAPPEWVFWGPKGAIAKGFYRVRVDLKCDQNDLFVFDVASAAGTVTHSRIEFFGSIRAEFPVRLDVDVADLECRLFNLT